MTGVPTAGTGLRDSEVNLMRYQLPLVEMSTRSLQCGGKGKGGVQWLVTPFLVTPPA